MRLALASASNVPKWEQDDASLHRALRGRAIDFEVVVWDDPSVDWTRFSTCLIRTTWDYHEKRAAFVAWAQARAEHLRFFNPASVIAWNAHKGYLRELERRGVCLAPTEWLHQGSTFSVADRVQARGWEHAFLKPAVGLCASDTLRFHASPDGLAKAQGHVDRLLPHGDLILQPYLKRVETEGEFSAIFFGGAFSHAVQKIPQPGDYRVQDDWGASDHPLTMSPVHRGFATKTLDVAQELLGERLLYARVDLILDDAGDPVLNELELVEPSLFFRHDDQAADRLVDALLNA